MSAQSLQERFAPDNGCFGCGPANELGLRIRSFPVEGTDDRATARWQPEKHHEAFDGVLSGGIIGTLLDCHSNWTAAWHLMRRAGETTPPCTVTAEFAVKLLRPCPTNGPVRLDARIVEASDDRAVVDASLEADGKTRATCHGIFVAVKPGHPAHHRW